MPEPKTIEVEIVHPYWKDRIFLHPTGCFKRHRTGCTGYWKLDERGLLHLDWSKWSTEVFESDFGLKDQIQIYHLIRWQGISLKFPNHFPATAPPISKGDHQETRSPSEKQHRPRIRLITSYYTDPDSDRQNELDACLSHNLRNPLIDQVVVLNESDRSDFASDKVVSIPHPRPTFREFFSAIDQITADADINILANSDIYVDDSVELLLELDLSNTVLALQRWECGINGYRIPPDPRPDSQDSWIWKGKMKPLGHDNFHLGKPGCDNRIAWEFRAAGYSVINPSTLIRTIHLHQSGIRHYGPDDLVSPPYYYVTPS